jgi:adenylate cyclase
MTIPGNQGRRIQYRVGLAAIVSLLVAATVVLVAGASLANTRAAIIEMADEQVRRLLRSLDTRVHEHLDTAVNVVQLSEGLLGNAILQRHPDILARHFVEVLRSNRELSWASYSDEKGNFTGAYRAPDQSLHISKTGMIGREVDAAVGADGRLKDITNKATVYDPRTDLFYTTAKAAGKLVWVGPVIFYDEAVPGIECAKPILKNGTIEGVLSADININVLSNFVEELHFGQNGRVFIFDEQRRVIAYPGLRIGQKTGGGAAGKLITDADVGDPVFQTFVTALLAPDKSTRQRKVDEEQFAFLASETPYHAGYRRLHVGDGPTWFVGAYAPESDFIGVLARTRWIAAAIALGVMIAGLLCTLWLARGISVPLTRLAAEMGEVGDFRLTMRPPMQTVFTEVGKMDESLLRMKSSLRSFSYYVPRDLVRAMLESGQEATLQGQTREMTIYFSDIVGMTSMAETMAPDELVRLLSRYFDEMTQVVTTHGGTVDKFIGDAIMVFWGAPAPTPDHAARACATALASQRRLAELRSGVPGLADLRARVGIATGEALVGNVGSHERFNYTAMGDTVNLASRLEGLNKVYGTEILISDATYQAARESIVARPVAVVQVKGKQRPVHVWEPLCLASEEDAAARELARLFTDGLAAYIARDFHAAGQFYEAALRLRPGDKPSGVLFERSRDCLTSPPLEHWDGVYVATHK